MDTSNPCPHWLLRPKGIEKRHIKQVLQAFGYIRTQAFLRWVANEDVFARNINDLDEERDPTKVFETTIRYRIYEWSFSCTQTDIDGHKISGSGRKPHFHFKMTINRQSFFDFNDSHCQLSEYDLFNFAIIRGGSPITKQYFLGGEGMRELFQPENFDKLIKTTETTLSPEDALLNFQTIIEPKNDQPISPEKIQALLRESQDKGVPLASLIHKLGEEVRAKIVI
jgi:hypothetical protein